MFRSLMKHIIVCYLDSTLVLTKENSRPRKSDSHIFKYNHRKKIISDVVSARALYSASALERATTVSFLLFQDS